MPNFALTASLQLLGLNCNARSCLFRRQFSCSPSLPPGVVVQSDRRAVAVARLASTADGPPRATARRTFPCVSEMVGCAQAAGMWGVLWFRFPDLVDLVPISSISSPGVQKLRILHGFSHFPPTPGEFV